MPDTIEAPQTTEGEAGTARMTQAMEQGEAAQRLDELARRIREEHEAAEQAQFDSLRHAREAGELLIQVKEQLSHGEFMPWVKDHCTFAHSTANLYMKIAREWDKLGNSQRNRKLSLSEAGLVLYSGDNEEYAQARSDLLAFGIVRHEDLEGLSVSQKRILVAEVRQMYDDFCEDPERDKIARDFTTRVRGAEVSFPAPITCDPAYLRTVTYEAILRLRDGTLAIHGVPRHLRGRLDSAVAHWAAWLRSQSGSRSAGGGGGGGGGGARAHYSPFERFRDEAERLIEMLPALTWGRSDIRGLLNRIADALAAVERKEAEEAEERAKHLPPDWPDKEFEEAMDATHPWCADETDVPATDPNEHKPVSAAASTPP